MEVSLVFKKGTAVQEPRHVDEARLRISIRYSIELSVFTTLLFRIGKTKRTIKVKDVE